jgi:hypothetical protein
MNPFLTWENEGEDSSVPKKYYNINILSQAKGLVLNHKSFGYIFVGAVSRPRLSRQECRSYIKTHLYLCDLALGRLDYNKLSNRKSLSDALNESVIQDKIVRGKTILLNKWWV